MFWTYILQSEVDGRLYIGSTGNLEERLMRHNSGRVSSTAFYKPWRLFEAIQFRSRSEAMALERKLKSWRNPERVKELVLSDKIG